MKQSMNPPEQNVIKVIGTVINVFLCLRNHVNDLLKNTKALEKIKEQLELCSEYNITFAIPLKAINGRMKAINGSV